MERGKGMTTALKRWIALTLIGGAIGLAIACTPAATPTATPTPAPSPTRTAVACSEQAQPVFQIDYPLLWGPPFKTPAQTLPPVTLWDNGCLVFVGSPNAHLPGFRQTVLSQGLLATLMEKAQVLYELGDSYTIQDGGGNVRFTIEEEKGRKVVTVHGLSVDDKGPAQGDTGLASRIQDLWATVWQALPDGAPIMQPNEVVVTTVSAELAGPPEGPITRTWPAELVGHLTGEQAKAAAGMMPLGIAAFFLVNGEPRAVAVAPVLPLLFEPALAWPRSGLPLHPALTAYDAPGMPYRFANVTQIEVAAWYRVGMAQRGWRLAGETQDSQVWAWERYDPSPLLVVLEFQPSEMTVQRVELVDGIPLYPRSRPDLCGDAQCQVASSVPLAGVDAWFKEFMGYAGWETGADGAHRKGNWEVRLEMQETNSGIRVLEHRSWAPSNAGETAAVSRDEAIAIAWREIGEVAGQGQSISAALVPGSVLVVRAGIWSQISEQEVDHPYWLVTFTGLPSTVQRQVVVDALTGQAEVL